MINTTRPDDTMAHYSGDEFGMLMRMEFDNNATDEEIEKKVQEILQDKFEEIQDLTKRPEGDDVKQEISAGYSIIDPESTDKHYFADYHIKADEGAEASKLLRILKEAGGEKIETIERIINADKAKEIIERNDAADIKKAKLFRNLKRAYMEAFPNMSAEELKKIILAQIEYLNNKDEEAKKIKEGK